MIGEMNMPQYKRKQYGRFQYGRYTLHASNGLKVSRAVRMRVIKNPLSIQTMQMTLSGQQQRLRIRTNQNEWLYGAEAMIAKETYKVRMRTDKGPWVESVRYTMKGE